MKIGKFINKVQTTKDTVRHYEKVGLLKPVWDNTHRIYGEKEINDFHAIKEMQALDMSLKEIQVIFEVKQSNGCGSTELLDEVIQTMVEKQQHLMLEEKTIRHKKEQITGMLNVLMEVNQKGKK